MDSPLGDRSQSRKQFHEWLQKSRIPKSIQFAGDEIEINDVGKWKILHPPLGYNAGRADDKSLVVRLDTPRARVLFLSDSGPDTFRDLLQTCPEALVSDILVLGHHHSGIPPDAVFLDAVRPSFIVVSRRGEFSNAEPMDSGWVNMLRERGITLLQQDQAGAVLIRSTLAGYEVEEFLGGKKFRK